MAILNGKKVEDAKIDPSKHKFIGMFRPVTWPISDGSWEVHLCSCGIPLWTVQGCQDHWRLGHMDIAQYIDIKE